jgi:hypothetical protein
MAPHTSKSKGKAPAQRGRPSQATSTVPPIPAPRPIHGEVLEALQNLWSQIEEFTVLNSSGPWLAVPSHLEFIRTHLPALVSNHIYFLMVFYNHFLSF